MINLQAEGKQGKGVKDIGEKGYVRVDFSCNGGEYICVDDYSGRGADYRKRKKTRITIGLDHETKTFDGMAELFSSAITDIYLVHETSKQSGEASVYPHRTLDGAVEGITMLVEEYSGEELTEADKAYIRKASANFDVVDIDNYTYKIEKTQIFK